MSKQETLKLGNSWPSFRVISIFRFSWVYFTTFCHYVKYVFFIWNRLKPWSASILGQVNTYPWYQHTTVFSLYLKCNHNTLIQWIEFVFYWSISLVTWYLFGAPLAPIKTITYSESTNQSERGNRPTATLKLQSCCFVIFFWKKIEWQILSQSRNIESVSY